MPMSREPIDLEQSYLELHDLCQPLTALQCRLEMGSMLGHPEDLEEAVKGGSKTRAACSTSSPTCGNGCWRLKNRRVLSMRKQVAENYEGVHMASANMAFDRSVILASADASLRRRLHNSLSGLRWDVREARGGAEAIAQLEGQPTEALLLDHWLPDLEVMELAEQIGALYPFMELLRIDGNPIAGGTRSPRRHELLHAVREALGSSIRESSAPDSLPSIDDAVTAGRVRASAEVRPAKSLLPSQPASEVVLSVQEVARTLGNAPVSAAGGPQTSWRSRVLWVRALSCWSWRAPSGWLRRTPRRY